MPLRPMVMALVAGALSVGAAPQAAQTDADVRARIAAAGTAADHNADTVVVFDWTNVRVRDNGIGTARNRRVVKILREGGIRSHCVQVFPFDPHTNRLDLVSVCVHRADGRIDDIPVDAPIVQPQAAGSIFWGTKQYVVTVPDLAVGDAIETVSDMTGFNVAYLADGDSSSAAGVAPERNYFGDVLEPPVPGHWHDEVHFWTHGVPIVEKRYEVRISRNKPLQFEIYNGQVRTAVVMDGDDLVYTFEARDLKPVRDEPSQEPWPNVAPKLLLATLPTWEDKARWLYEVSEPHFEADDVIRETVDRIIAGCRTDEEKYTALNHWVAENIRYAGTSRGMCEGYTIHPSIETFHDRAGVCKDKAGMLVTMLRCAGFDSFLVMTMARQRVDRVPADQFNHAVTCIRWPDGSLTLLDPTWMPKSRDNWSTLEPLQHVVYGLPEGKELSRSDYFPPEDCAATWKATTRFNDDGDLSGHLDFEACGAPEGRLRRTLGGLHPDERPHFFVDTFQRLSPNVQVANVACMDPVDFSGPLTIASDYRAAGFVLGERTRRVFKLPMLQTVLGNRALYDLFGVNGLSERKYGIKLLATRLATFEETIELPPSWRVERLPDPVELDGPSASLSFAIESAPGRIRYTCRLVIKRWLIPPDEYANFKKVMDKFEELAGPVVMCEAEGGHAQR